MPGLWKLEMELSRKEAIAAAERKLARSLTEPEQAGIRNLDSMLRLKACARVLTDLAALADEIKREGYE